MDKKIYSSFVCVILFITMSISAGAVSVSLKDFDNGHSNFDADGLKIEYSLSSAAGADGVVYVYSGDVSNLSDGNPPKYMNYISNPSDDYSADISFLEGFGYGEYTLLYVSSVGSDSATFEYYSDSDLLQNKKNTIFNELKALENPNGSAVKGVFNKRSDTFSIISADADMTAYNKVSDTDAIYAKMVESIALLENYDAMVDLFEAKATEQFLSESYVTGGTGNLTPGNTNTVITDHFGGGGGGGVTGGGTGIAPIGFSDMKSHWAEKYVTELKSRGIMDGYDDGSFRGENPITRAELAKILSVLLNLPMYDGNNYTDVLAGEWYSPYIGAVYAANIVTGFEDGSFRPNDNIIRQDAALMIYRALSTINEIPMGYTVFADELKISDYASNSVRGLADVNIITGTPEGNFNPLSTITRAEISALICRSLDYIESH